MKASFTISGKLAGLNEIVNAARYNRFAGASKKKAETKRCMWAVVAGSVPTFTVPVKISFTWIEPNGRRDLDNISTGAKFVLDALVELGRLPNDGRKWLKAIQHHFPDPDAKNPHIVVEIETVDG